LLTTFKKPMPAWGLTLSKMKLAMLAEDHVFDTVVMTLE
jgi:hypothetical protein